MAITDKKKGVWDVDQVYNKINEGDIWTYNLLDTSKFFVWGYNNKAQLGLNESQPTRTGYSSPTQLPGSTWDLNPSNGGTMDQTAATKTDGTLWAWGRNNAGQLGQNTINLPSNSNTVSSPVQIPGTTWNTVCMGGGGDTRCTKTDGTLWAWGSSYWGQGGQNTAQGGGQYNYSSPTQVGTDTNWALGTNKHNFMSNGLLALKTNGTLWAWGYNGYGMLGTNQAPATRGGYSSPTQVGTDTNWSAVLGGSQEGQTGAIKTDGTLWMWGRNEKGSLGQNSTGASFSSPTQVPGTTWANGRFLNQSVLLTKTDGTMWTIGDNSAGQLGHNSEVNYSSPVQLPGTWHTSNFIGGYYYAVAAKSDGSLWSWGYNSQGQLAQNHTDPNRVSSPVQIPGTWGKLQSTGQGTMAEMVGTP